MPLHRNPTHLKSESQSLLTRLNRWCGWNSHSAIPTIYIITILFVEVCIQVPHLNEMPLYIHAWAQGDRYALAIGYTRNGMDFFHPQTLLLNKQFPNHWSDASDSPITAVDCPLHEWIVAALMMLFGTTAPWVFRLWTLLISLAGLALLYALCGRLRCTPLRAAIVTYVAASSPLYAYYCGNFLPSAPSLALTIAAIYCYTRHLETTHCRWWNMTMAFMAMAVLMRSSFAIPLVALLCFEALRIIHHETHWRGEWVAPAIVVIVVGAMMAWGRCFLPPP